MRVFNSVLGGWDMKGKFKSIVNDKEYMNDIVYPTIGLILTTLFVISTIATNVI